MELEVMKTEDKLRCDEPQISKQDGEEAEEESVG